jgi:D-inositol-3-phosphate glycosyltransferase
VSSGPLPPTTRHAAGSQFTVAQSVDTLLNVFAQPEPIPPATILRQLEELVLASPNDPPRNTPSTNALIGTASLTGVSR